ncbi:MAG: D-alanyl-D-alanine carboxypeptidase, partial [Myxococcota bacterium]
AEAFPDITPHADYESVTLEMLLAHVGGTWSSLGEHPDVWGELWESGDVVEQRAWFAEQVLAEGPEVTPGTQYLYSNTGYMLVGAAMEAVTGESWEALMQVHLLDPLEMTSCGFGAPDPDGNLSHPWGHSSGAPVDGSSLYADNPRALGPAGTVHCSMTDWGKFASAHLAGARGESSYLGEDSFTRMHTPVLSDYALGWSVAVRSWAGETPALTHTGTNSMFYSNIWLAPDINTAFLTATNQGDSSSALDETIGTLIGL